jgi:hypothetical protein
MTTKLAKLRENYNDKSMAAPLVWELDPFAQFAPFVVRTGLGTADNYETREVARKLQRQINGKRL